VTQSAMTTTNPRRSSGSIGPRDTTGYRIFTWANNGFLVVLSLAMLFPFAMLVAQSFSSPAALKAGRVGIWPVGFTLDTYKFLMQNQMFWLNYRNTVVYTVVATVIAMVLTTLMAYVLARRHLRARGFLVGIVVFTMFFNGGLIPNYVLISALGMKNTIWAIVVPGAISVFNLLVMKSFFENQPLELEEAAQIDGLGWFGIFTRIVLPLSQAVLATMILFYSVGFWNDWFAAFLYLDRQELFPVTLFLRNVIAGASSTASEGAAAAGMNSATQIAESVKAVAMILTLIPILCVYPFVQRYFVSGVMLGSVKG